MSITKICEQCKNPYDVTPSRINRRFCSKRCSGLAQRGKHSPQWKGGRQSIRCEFCNKSFHVYPCEVGGRKYCSTKCYGNAVDENKTYKSTYRNGATIAIHRVIMENHIGRPLNSDEDVHHINGNIRDNRIENLMLLSHSEHMRLETLNRSPEENARIASFRVGLKRSEETRRKMSKARKNWWKRKKSQSH